MAAACDVGTAIEAYVARSGRPGIDADICNWKGLYRVEHQTLPVSFFCDSYGMLQDIYLKFCIETLQTYI